MTVQATSGLGLLLVPLTLWTYVRIARQAGYSGWWAVAALIPGVNIIVYLLFAFREWPVSAGK